MAMPRFDVAEPRTVREACRLLAEAPDGAEPLAGGTELLLAIRHQTRHPGLLVDLSRVEGLDELTYSPGRGLQIGARVTLKRLIADPAGGLRRFPPYRLPEHETVYAMTVHKSQGSEFENVLLVLPPADSPVLSRELVYTALTRARKRFTLFGRREVLTAAVRRRIERTSGLREALWG